MDDIQTLELPRDIPKIPILETSNSIHIPNHDDTIIDFGDDDIYHLHDVYQSNDIYGIDNLDDDYEIEEKKKRSPLQALKFILKTLFVSEINENF
jgi:hypothetical protein